MKAKQHFLWALMLTLLSGGVWGQVTLLAWETNGLSGTTATLGATTTATNIESSTLVRGSGLTASSLSNGFAASGWNETTLAATITAGNYFEVTVEASTGNAVSLNEISFNFRRSSSGPNNLQWHYSLDNVNYIAIGSAMPASSTASNGFSYGPIDVSAVTDLQNVAAGTTIYLRLYGWGASSSGGTGAIGRLSGDDLVVTGTTAPVSSSGPDNPASFTATANSGTQINLSATANTAADNIVVVWNTANTFGTPSGTYTANDAVTGGGTVLYVGAAGSLTNHTGLTAGIQYFYRAYSVNGTNYSNGLSADATTLKGEPSNHVASFSATANGTSQIDLTWTDNNGAVAADGFLILGKTGAGTYATVSDGTSVADDSDWSDGNFAVNVNSGVESASVTGLSASTAYDFIIYPYTNSGVNIDYLSSPTVPTVSESTAGGIALTTPGTPYTQDFAGFTSAASLPSGWSVSGSNTNYAGTWGATSTGMLGNANVLGYQHTSSTGTFTSTLTIQNNTGNTIEALEIAYQGKVERASEGRSPEFAVSINGGTPVPALTYSTSGGVDQNISAVVTGLSIANGNAFTIEWSSDRGGGSGSSKQIGLSNVSVQVPLVADVALSDNGTQIGAANVNQGAVNHILSQTQAAVTAADAILTSLSFTPSGTYDETSDIVNFKLRYSTDATLDAGDATLATLTSIPASTNAASFSGLSQSITQNTSGYFFITADIAANAGDGNTIAAGAPSYTFGSANITGNSMTAAGAQTIQNVTPAVALSDNGSQISAASVSQNSQNQPLSSFALAVTVANANLTALDVTTAGNYTAAGVANLQLWYSSDNTFDANSDQSLATISAPTVAGTQSFSGFNQLITASSTAYFYVTVDFTCDAQNANSINLAGIANSDLSFSAAVNASGSASAAGSQSIQFANASNVSNLAATGGNTEVSLNWTNPSDCFDELIIVAHTASIGGSPTGTYTANSQVFTDGTNPAFPSGGTVVYNGSTAPQTITGLTNNSQYFFKVFTRNGTNWSSGVEVNATPENICGFENFANSNATSSYVDGSFVGQNGVTWSYFASRDENGDVNGSGIDGKALMLRRSSDNSRVVSSAVSGGIGDFSVKLYKGFTGSGNRQVELFVNGISIATSTPFDDFSEHIFSVNGVNIPGNVTVEIRNITSGQVIVDDIRWACYNSTGDFTYDGTAWNPSSPIGTSTSAQSIEVSTGSVSISADTECSDIKLGASATLTITSGNTLTVAGAIENNGSIVVESEASLLQSAAGANSNSGSGTYDVIRTINVRDHLRFSFWSSPVQNAQIETVFSSSNANDRLRFGPGSSSASYSNYSTGTMNPGEGYAVTPSVQTPASNSNFSDTRTFSGAINNGDVNITVNGVTNGDFILLGNPYPSALDFSAFAAANTAINATVYFWDSSPAARGQSGFANWNNGGGNGIGNSNRQGPNQNLRSTQGFMVQATQDGNLNLSFTNAMRVAGSNASSRFFKNDTRERLWLGLANDSGAYNTTLIALADDATDGRDRLYDAQIFKANQYQSLYSDLNGDDCSIQGLAKLAPGETKVVALGVDAWTIGTQKLTLDSLNNWPANQSIILLDSLLGRSTDLSQQDYSFVVNSIGEIRGRFYLKMGQANTVGLAEKRPADLLYFQKDRSLVLDDRQSALDLRQARLLSLSGNPVLSQVLEEGQTRHALSLDRLAAAVYLLQVTDANGLSHHYKVAIQ